MREILGLLERHSEDYTTLSFYPDTGFAADEI